MRNQLDKVFKNKLAEHSLPPTEMAWSKVQANLSKKNKGLIWFRMAAAVVFFGLLAGGILWFTADGTQPGTPIAKSGETEKKAADKTKVKGTKQETNAGAKVKIEKKKPVVRGTTNVYQHLATVPANAPKEVTEPVQQVVAEENNTVEKAEEKSEMVQPQIVEKTAIAAAPEKPMVIEYTLESVEPLPVEKSIVLTIDLKEKKGLQKVLDFALEAKSGDGPLAGLRQAKDEFFAFNFTKKDKPKNPK